MLQRSPRRWIEKRGGTAVRVLVTLAAVGCCLGGIAYAANRPAPPNQPQGRSPLQPRITEHPDPVTTTAVANFDFVQPGRPPARSETGKPLRYECRFDGGKWRLCRRPMRFGGLDTGRHRFDLRAINSAYRRSPIATYGWRIRKAAAPREATPTPAPPTPPAPPTNPTPPLPPAAESMPFTIELAEPLEDLFPGAPAQSLALRVVNPNPAPISVTSLSVAIAADPPGCPASENFTLIPSDVSPATPLRVEAESSLILPAQRVAPPTIAMRELPVDQNACQGANLDLVFEGDASG